MQQGYDYRLVASIHDEYQFEVRRDQAERFGDMTQQAMKLVEKELNVQCPLDSEYKIGKNWYETHFWSKKHVKFIFLINTRITFTIGN